MLESKIKKLSAILLCCLSVNGLVQAATPLNLRQQSIDMLKPYLEAKRLPKSSPVAFKEIHTEFDVKNTAHTRFQATYANIPVWGGDIVIHTPQAKKKTLAAKVSDKQTTMNGTFYQDLEKDLTDASVLNETQKNKAIQKAINTYQFETKSAAVQEQSAKPVIFVDTNNKANFAYEVSFYVDDSESGESRPVYLIDAKTLMIYATWNNIQTAMEKVISKGGNVTSGEVNYDDEVGHLPALKLNVVGDNCVFENNSFVFKAWAKKLFPSDYKTIQNRCEPIVNTDSYRLILGKASYLNLEDAGSFNDAFSPVSDVYYGAGKTQELFQTWYGVSVFLDPSDQTKAGKLPVFMHYETKNDSKNWANASFDGKLQVLKIGDGNASIHPLVSIDIVAHEIAHAFTFQHSRLIYQAQSGGLNESFSDITAQAVQFFAEGNNTWTTGEKVTKNSKPVRYMDEPKKDGQSLDHFKDFKDTIGVHRSSGIFNKAFYTLANKPDWGVRKAYNVMIDGNRYYWTANSSFHEAACGVLKAGKTLNYNTNDIKEAFQVVGITIPADCDSIGASKTIAS